MVDSRRWSNQSLTLLIPLVKPKVIQTLSPNCETIESMEMILKKPEAIYVSPKQMERQQKDSITVRESGVHVSDAVSELAKAWGISKFA